MIRLTLLLSGSIWAAMAFAPDLDEPVFTEQVAEVAPIEDVTPEPANNALVNPIKVAAVMQAAPEPVKVAEVAVLAPTPTAETDHLIWFVTGSRVNVREQPTTNSSVMGKVIYGEAALVVSDPDADWVKIRIEGDGVEGYIMKRFMTDVDPLG